MSEKLSIDVDVNTSELDRAESKRVKLETDTINTVEKVETEAERSYNQVMNMARGSMMIFSGIAHAIGGTFGRIFSAVYMTATSIFTLYTSIAAATATINPYQAALQMAAVVLSMSNLVAVINGQRESSRILRGVTTSLHGVSQMISSYSL